MSRHETAFGDIEVRLLTIFLLVLVVLGLRVEHFLEESLHFRSGSLEGFVLAKMSRDAMARWVSRHDG
jgi:hypothetical protein